MQMDEVYRNYSLMVYKYILSLSHDENTAEEVTQETFYQAVKDSDRFDGSCKVSTWLCGIAANKLKEYRRKYPASEELDETWPSEESVEARVLRKQESLELMKRIHAMAEPQREIMMLRLYSELSFAEIAEILGISEERARVTFYRGKVKLRKEMNEDE
ncbi:MAG: sigma-70 family RNA polymerase sigma factor [Solobacterium sp.]|nr:sigma-70 family RNA polymerase sigma factor [Solobacterium sp.]